MSWCGSVQIVRASHAAKGPDSLGGKADPTAGGRHSPSRSSTSDVPALAVGREHRRLQAHAGRRHAGGAVRRCSSRRSRRRPINGGRSGLLGQRGCSGSFARAQGGVSLTRSTSNSSLPPGSTVALADAHSRACPPLTRSTRPWPQGLRGKQRMRTSEARSGANRRQQENLGQGAALGKRTQAAARRRRTSATSSLGLTGLRSSRPGTVDGSKS